MIRFVLLAPHLHPEVTKESPLPLHSKSTVDDWTHSYYSERSKGFRCFCARNQRLKPNKRLYDPQMEEQMCRWQSSLRDGRPICSPSVWK